MDAVHCIKTFIRTMRCSIFCFKYVKNFMKNTSVKKEILNENAKYNFTETFFYVTFLTLFHLKKKISSLCHVIEFFYILIYTNFNSNLEFFYSFIIQNCSFKR